MPPGGDDTPRSLTSTLDVPDRSFKTFAFANGTVVVVVMTLVGLFLLFQGYVALQSAGVDFLTTQAWDPNSGNFGIAAVLAGTFFIALTAISVALPLSLGTALYISEYAPIKIKAVLVSIVDLMAAIPSVVYGLWGIQFLALNMVPVYKWLEDHAGWIPFFEGPVPNSGRTMFTAGLVLAVMALPIITAICREVFAQTPKMHQEAALALGATRWEMIRLAVFPYARSGMVSAVLLGLGRALGETMAVALVLAPTLIVSFNLVTAEQSSSTIAANIALNFGNASGSKIETLIFSGLVLFVITFAVNFLGRSIAARGRKG